MRPFFAISFFAISIYSFDVSHCIGSPSAHGLAAVLAGQLKS